MSGQHLPSDILLTVYQYLDSLDTHAISTVALVSRAFNAVFHTCLYKHLVVAHTNSRIPSLIRTLRDNPGLRNIMQSLTVRLDYTSHKFPKFLQRVFKNPPDHFHRFVQLIIDTSPPGLRYLAIITSKPGRKIFSWDSLGRKDRGILLSLRCSLPTIRGLRFDGIGFLERDMVRGRDGCPSLEALHIYSTSLPSQASHPEPQTTATATTGELDEPSLIPVLSSTPSSSFCNLKTIDIDHPRAAYEDRTDGLYTLILESCRETLRQIHLRVTPEPIGREEDELQALFPFLVDFEGHTSLKTVVISSYLPGLPPNMTHGEAVELLKPYYTHILASEFAAIASCLRAIVKLPPFLTLLRIHIHLAVSDIQLDEALQIQSGRVEGSVLQWDFRTLDAHLVDIVHRSTGGSLEHVELGIQFVPRLASGLGEDRRVRLERMFVGMRGVIGDGFSVYIDDECRTYRP